MEKSTEKIILEKNTSVNRILLIKNSKTQTIPEQEQDLELKDLIIEEISLEEICTRN